MNTVIPMLVSTIAGLSTLIGATTIFFKVDKSKYNKFITFSLAFSIAIMIGISIFDLIPESFFSIFQCLWNVQINYFTYCCFLNKLYFYNSFKYDN